MFRVRKAHQRGHANHGWLDTYHTFSFADYQDPAQMGFRALRVINEDRVAPGQGFGMHGHRDMEIITYVLSGELKHEDSLGNGEVLRPGEFQRMTAGSGIRHSEFNPSATKPVHLYQIWLLPNVRGAAPSYEQKPFSPEERQGRLRLVASPDGADGSLSIGQDAKVFLTSLAAGQTVSHQLAEGRHAWLQVLRGAVDVAGNRLETSDAVAISDETRVALTGAQNSASDAEVMLFDLA